MNRFLITLVLCLLLSGCAAQNPQPEESPSSLPTAATQPEASRVSSSLTLKADASGSRFSLSETVTGFLPLGENVLFFSGTDSTTLTLMDLHTREVLAVHETGMVLMPENATVQILDTGISYFNGHTRETVVLDRILRDFRRIPAPADLTGMPLMSPEGHTLYYCTPSAVRALDLDSGISRVIKETAYPVQSLSGLLWGDSILQLSITDTDGTWRTLYLSGGTGQLLQEQTGNLVLQSMGEGYFLHGRLNDISAIVFGKAEETPCTLHPRLEAEDVFCLTDSILTTGWENSTLVLDLYDPESGLRTASFCAASGQYPRCLSRMSDGSLWVLWEQEDGQATLLERLTPTPVSDDTGYTTPYYTRKEPDYEGLAACALYAQELSEKHGIQILVYKDAVALEPWDYHMDYEYQPPVLRRELEALDARLSRLPKGFLQTLRDKFTGLTICIVRSVEGSPASGSLTAANGIQFMDGFDAYIALATGHDTEYALYHELCHLMETVVLTESTAYDRWDNLNPPDFRYDSDSAAGAHRDGSPWLKDGSQYFVDAYSMSSPREDRARLFEYAMTSGHQDLFRSPNLQQKLRQLCTGIREGFGLEDYAGPLPWEQYLSE